MEEILREIQISFIKELMGMSVKGYSSTKIKRKIKRLYYKVSREAEILGFQETVNFSRKRARRNK